MQNLEDGDGMREMSALRPFGQDYPFRVSNRLKPGSILEVEVEVLEFGSSALPSQA